MRSPFETVSEYDDSWAYPDEESLVSFATHEVDDPTLDADLLELRTDPNAYAFLSAAEYRVVDRRFGLTCDSESMKDIAHELGITHNEARDVLAGALSKMRSSLSAEG